MRAEAGLRGRRAFGAGRAAVWAALLLCARVAGAQPQLPLPELSPSARLTLVTVLPGDEIYSLYGHSALRIADPALGLDRTYNYGTFDFGNPVVFALRFAHGRLDYLLSVGDFTESSAYYQQTERRPVLVQPLRLSREQVQAVFAYLEINALPQNRTYRYNFLFDNCSTRLRLVLERALGEAVRFPAARPTGRTYRELIDVYQQKHPFVDAGIDLLLGLPVDRPADTRGAAFAPEALMQAFAAARVRQGGAWRPLAAAPDTLLPVAGYRSHPRGFPLPMLLSWGLLAVGGSFTLAAPLRRRAHALRGKAWPDALLFGFAGAAGLALTYLWAFSEHTLTSPNLHLLWAWPTHAAALVWLRRPSRWARRYWAAAALAAGACALAWGWLPQALQPVWWPVCALVALRAAARAGLLPSTLYANPKT